MEPRPEQSWLGVEVRHLAALRAVAEEGTFGAAALRLGYAQSAISQQIAALERHVGHRLFDRPGGSRPVTLTRAGALLLEHAETILSRLAAARIDLDSLGEEEDVTAPLRIGAYQSVAAAILPPVLQEIGVDPCDVGFELRESSDDRELLALLESGELDVAFAELPLQEGPLEASPLLDDPYVLVVPSEHELADLGRAVTLEELATLPLILLKGNSGEARLGDAFALHGIAPRVAHRVADGTTLAGLVVAGLGLGLVPRLAAQTEGRALATLPVESRLPARTIGIAWHRERLRTCTAGLFVDLAVEVAERVGEGAVASS